MLQLRLFLSLAFSQLLLSLVIASSSQPLPPPRALLLWATLLNEYNIPSTSLDRAALIDVALASFNSFLTSSSSPNNDSSEPQQGDAFYRYQLSNPIANDQSDGLRTVAAQVFEETLSTYYNKELTESQRSGIYCWATVNGGRHARSSWHPPHTHSNSVLSGVYYPKVNDLSSPITFVDARSAFTHSNKHHHSPVEGSFVVFPSWLQHYVGPTDSEEERISFSCNCPGEWEETSDLNLEL
jgi:hypothetical protein